MPNPIWKKSATCEQINALHQSTLCGRIGIELLEIGEDFLRGRMPVDERTVQPMGILHGGASVALAETLGSVAAWLSTDEDKAAVGLEVNANHLRPVRTGWVQALCTPVHLGRTTQVWQIELSDDAGRRSCVSRITMAVIDRPDPPARAPRD